MKQFFKFLFASVFGTFIAIALLFGVLFGILGIVASTVGDQEVKIKDNSVIYMDFSKDIADRSSNDPFENFDFNKFQSNPSVGLNDIIRNLEKASQDDRVKGVFLDLTFVEIGMARMNEIRNALENFQDSGKFVYAYGDALSQNAYYMASMADKIYLNPGGIMELKGLSSNRMFFKGTFEKLDVDMQVIRHGKYKSAVEPFTREDMSEASRLQTRSFVTSIWNNMVGNMSESRSIEGQRMNDFASGLLINSPADALNAGLTDGVKYRDEVIAEMKELLEIEADDDIEFISHGKYKKASLPNGDEKSLEDFKTKIAVVYAAGEIRTGESDSDVMGSKTIAKAIEEARNDEHVKAVVLRVNSPGGSSLASDIIWREVELTKKEKPVVVSMGNLAASGGYYISCGANKIVADPNTITGSIGVFGIIPNSQRFFKNKLGVTFDTVNTNTYSDFGSPVRPLKDMEVQYITKIIERIYDDFVNKVSEGRSMTYAEVDSIGQGRVWSGTEALEIGLVDELGGMSRAIEIAGELAEIEDYQLMELPKQDDPFKEMLGQFSDDMESKFAKAYFGEHFTEFNKVYKGLTDRGIFTRMPYDLIIE